MLFLFFLSVVEKCGLKKFKNLKGEFMAKIFLNKKGAVS
jgi:hypothetical protein